MKYVYMSLLTALLLGASTISANAGLVNDIPSCYKANHLKFPSRQHARLVYVLIDQTVELTPGLKKSVIANVNRLLGPGSKFVVAKFSAFSQGRYQSVIHTGIIEYPLTHSESQNVPMNKLPAIRGCLKDQKAYAIQLADKSLNKVMKGAKSSLDHSDILAAVKHVAPVIRSDEAKDKVLLLVTDGLENSSVMTFYRNHGIARVHVKQALKKVKQQGMVGDLGGARVYVIGGGLMPPSKRGNRAERDGYRDPVTMSHLKAFWRGIFQASNATLKEFGEPALVQPISY